MWLHARRQPALRRAGSSLFAAGAVAVVGGVLLAFTTPGAVMIGAGLVAVAVGLALRFGLVGLVYFLLVAVTLLFTLPLVINVLMWAADAIR